MEIKKQLHLIYSHFDLLASAMQGFILDHKNHLEQVCRMNCTGFSICRLSSVP